METINHFQCFDYMIDSANDILDEDFIKNTHKILKTNTSDRNKILKIFEFKGFITTKDRSFFILTCNNNFFK